MPARRTRGNDVALEGRLVARLKELEDRVRLLEARFRTAVAEARRPLGRRTPAKGGKRKPRCPGCTLELPSGRKGEACVWCGFRFDAGAKMLR